MVVLSVTVLWSAESQEAGAVTGDVSIPLTPVHFLAFGDPGVFDDCVYAEMQGTTGAPTSPVTAPSRFDFRYTPCLGKPTLSVLGDADQSETGYPASDSGNTAPTVALRYQDANGNSVFNADEALYLGAPGTGTTLTGSTGPTAFTIRLTAAGGKPAGSFVFNADPDRISAASLVALTSPSLAWIDRDATTTFTAADSLYLLPTTAPGLAKGSVFPANAVKLYPATATTTTSSSPSPTTTTTSTATTTTTSATTTTTTSDSAPISSLPPRTRAPGFEAVLVVAGLAAVGLVLARRTR